MRLNQAPIDYTERDRLVNAHIGLVKATAHRLAQRLPPQVEVTDLISIGVLGLIDAAGRYRPSLGVPFDAFARRTTLLGALNSLSQLVLKATIPDDWRRREPGPRPVRQPSSTLEDPMASSNDGSDWS